MKYVSMGGNQWHVKLRKPLHLSPDSIAELILQYTNKNDYPHSVRSLSLTRTWDLEYESYHPINCRVNPGETECLPPIPLDTPPGIGGRQGVRVRFEVWGHSDDETMGDSKQWGASPLRRKVRNSDDYRPIFCVSGSGDCSAVRQLAYNWGFDIREEYDQQGVIESFNESEILPIALFGIVLPSTGGSSSRGLVSAAATIALDRNRVPLIFRHDRVSDDDMPDLHDQCIIIEFDPDDELRLEQEAALQFLALRYLEETGRLTAVVQWLKRKSVKRVKRLFDSWVNIAILSAAGLAASAENPVGAIENMIANSDENEFDSQLPNSNSKKPDSRLQNLVEIIPVSPHLKYKMEVYGDVEPQGNYFWDGSTRLHKEIEGNRIRSHIAGRMIQIDHHEQPERDREARSLPGDRVQ